MKTIFKLIFSLQVISWMLAVVVDIKSERINMALFIVCTNEIRNINNN